MSDLIKSSDISDIIKATTKQMVEEIENLAKEVQESEVDEQGEFVTMHVNGKQYDVPKDKYEEMKNKNKDAKNEMKNKIKEYVKSIKEENKKTEE